MFGEPKKDMCGWSMELEKRGKRWGGVWGGKGLIMLGTLFSVNCSLPYPKGSGTRP